MTRTTRAQRVALMRKFDQNDPKPDHELNRQAWFRRYRAFRRTVVAGGGCIMVRWCNMWLGIERDGYTHS